MNTEQKVYEVQGIWSDTWLTDADRLRIEELSQIVVSMKVRSLVDVGCGNGLFLNYLKKVHSDKFERLCGVERSTSAITQVNTEKYNASIDNIPLNDGEFEFVSCQEVIEHLPETIYEKAIKELGRISSKYVMISVPHGENLEKSLIPCPHCRTKFNPEYHMRSYTINELTSLERWLNAKVIKTGYIQATGFAFPKALSLVAGGYNAFPVYTICPMCGYEENEKMTQSPTTSGEVGEPTGLKKIGKMIWPKKTRDRWVYAIYQLS